MVLLIVTLCLASEAGPECASEVFGPPYADAAACRNEAVIWHDRLRRYAGERGREVLLLETRCLDASPRRSVPTGG